MPPPQKDTGRMGGSVDKETRKSVSVCLISIFLLTHLIVFDAVCGGSCDFCVYVSVAL